MVVMWKDLTKPHFFQKDERLNGSTFHKDLLPFTKKKMTGYLAIRIGVSNKMEQVLIPTVELKPDAKSISSFLFQRKSGHPIHRSLIHWFILFGIEYQIIWNTEKSKPSSIYPTRFEKWSRKLI